MNIEFHHGEVGRKVGFGLTCAYVHDCITDSEYDRILRRFQKKISLDNIKTLAESGDGE